MRIVETDALRSAHGYRGDVIVIGGNFAEVEHGRGSRGGCRIEAAITPTVEPAGLANKSARAAP